MMTKILNTFWHREDHTRNMNESENSISSQRKMQRKTPKVDTYRKRIEGRL
jgi:hypothetical protein